MQGIAPALPAIRDAVFSGGFNGGTCISGNFAEYFEMQFGGGIDFSFAVTEAEMYQFVELLTFYRSIYARSYPIVQYTESNLLAHVLNSLGRRCTQMHARLTSHLQATTRRPPRSTSGTTRTSTRWVGSLGTR